VAIGILHKLSCLRHYKKTKAPTRSSQRPASVFPVPRMAGTKLRPRAADPTRDLGVNNAMRLMTNNQRKYDCIGPTFACTSWNVCRSLLSLALHEETRPPEVQAALIMGPFPRPPCIALRPHHSVVRGGEIGTCVPPLQNPLRTLGPTRPFRRATQELD